MGTEPEHRVSHGDIARKAGFHRSTVSLALKKHPGIPESTRLKILKVAQKLGYRPDPALAALAHYRRTKSGAARRTTIGLISDEPVNATRKRLRHSLRDYYQGIRSRAEELGFAVDEFPIGNADRRFQDRVNKILRARGINALIICPLYNQELPVDLDWHLYSTVCIGHSLKQPEVLRVSSHIQAGAFEAVHQLYDLGYRRIGLVLGQSHDMRVNYAWSAGFFGACHRPDLKGIEFEAYMPDSNATLATRNLVRWVKSSRVDALLVAQDDLYDFLCEQGFEIPAKLGFACLDQPPERPELAGIDQLSFEIGRHAVDQVSGLYYTNERGIPTNQVVHLVKGQWREGASVRRTHSPR